MLQTLSPRRVLATVLLATCGAVVGVPAIGSAAAAAGESGPPLTAAQAKAGFIYNLAMFVEWPVAGDDRQADRVLAKTDGTPVLTIGEGSGFASRGGIIRVYVEHARLSLRSQPRPRGARAAPYQFQASRPRKGRQG